MKYWVKGDLNGFFGLFTNNLTNILVMASLLTLVVGLPANLVYTRILPAVGLSIFAASMYYSYMAWRLAKLTGRTDVTALPSGSSVPHMFLIVFLVIGPVYWSTNNAGLAWAAGVAWAFVEGVIEVLGTLIGEKVRKTLPRAAMLGSLAGVSLTFIALNPAFSIFAVPYIGLVGFAVVLLGFVGRHRMPLNLPAGLIIIVVGTVIGWVAGYMDLQSLFSSLDSVRFALPLPSFLRIFEGLDTARPFILAAIPLGIYNFIETIDNCESASVAGDNYNTREALLADGLTTLAGSIFGSPFPTAIFIGHPGWKAVGARIGYVGATGAGVLLMTSFGLVSLLLNVIPLVAILPILLYIGVVITTQAFTAVDSKYAPAVVVAIIPWLADWTRNAVDIALGSAGTSASTVGFTVLATAGLEYAGLSALGGGAIVVGMLLGSLVVHVIDKRFIPAAVTALIGSILTFFGLIHSTAGALNANQDMAIGYALVALVFTGYHFWNKRRIME